jgi:hypothetical protein
MKVLLIVISLFHVFESQSKYFKFYVLNMRERDTMRERERERVPINDMAIVISNS